MSLSGSWSRRFPWFASRPAVTARAAARPVPPRAKPLTVRRVTRDFALWESEWWDSEGAERTAVAPTTLTTVVGGQIVEVTLGDRPIEEVACHLRRLRSAMDLMTSEVSFVRWEGVIRAYDDYLFAACHELGVPTDLVTIGFGRHRDEERCRLEGLLREAGLPVR